MDLARYFPPAGADVDSSYGNRFCEIPPRCTEPRQVVHSTTLPPFLEPRPLTSSPRFRTARFAGDGVHNDSKNEDSNRSALPGVADLAGGAFIPPRLARINRGSVMSSLAVKGEAMIHGPYLAARSVASEWRTRRPSQLIQFNC
jgi:hypothetical protein